MSTTLKRKAMLRKIVLDILHHQNAASNECNQFLLLRIRVREMLAKNKDRTREPTPADVYPDLSLEDDQLLLEIFWDLFVEKVITLGLDSSKPGFPFFRFHSEGKKG